MFRVSLMCSIRLDKFFHFVFQGLYLKEFKLILEVKTWQLEENN